MSGLDRVTGKSISGWELYASRFKNAITTQKGSRVKRRGYGSRYPELLGKMQNGINQALAQAYIVDAYYNESCWL